jgi:hypothetical protein
MLIASKQAQALLAAGLKPPQLTWPQERLIRRLLKESNTGLTVDELKAALAERNVSVPDFDLRLWLTLMILARAVLIIGERLRLVTVTVTMG